MRALFGLCLLAAGVPYLSAACGELEGSGEFRPAKGVEGLSAHGDAYRVPGPLPDCREIGNVVRAPSLEAIASSAAKHGGTHYQVLSDFGDTTIETDTTATRTFGGVSAHSSSREAVHHQYVARVYRCEQIP